MFTKPTVFILGAGASCHYGYPTGEGLVNNVRTKAKELESIINLFRRRLTSFTYVSHCVPITPKFILQKAGVNFDMIDLVTDASRIDLEKEPIKPDYYNRAIQETIDQCQSLQTRLNLVDPPIIDHFLNRNTDLKEIGKLLIAWSILEKEKSEAKFKRNQEKGGNWYRYIMQQLMSGCEKPEDLLKNQVKFVTFNYDVSLERNLYEGIKQNSFFEDDSLVNNFFREDRFIHVYGKIKYNPTSPIIDLDNIPKKDAKLTLEKEILDQCYLASRGIRTIAPAEKCEDEQILCLAKDAIRQAERVYILGYGFDKENSKNIGLDECLNYNQIVRGFGSEPKENYKGKEIFFTNYQNKNVISKRASQIFYSNPSMFLPPNGLISSHAKREVHYEMSTKSAYKALSDDFEIFD